MVPLWKDLETIIEIFDTIILKRFLNEKLFIFALYDSRKNNILSICENLISKNFMFKSSPISLNNLKSRMVELGWIKYFSSWSIFLSFISINARSGYFFLIFSKILYL